MKIQILMSTYNGGQYLREQLDSIAEQTIKNIKLTIRDDGSSDDTIKIIQEYQKQYSWIFLVQGEHVGVQKSFLDLILYADPDCDYVALADQDDVWYTDKLEQAVKCMEKMNTDSPILYCSDKQIVDRDLKPLNVSVSRIVRKVTFGNALVQCICTGCTAVINQKMLGLLKENPPIHPEDIIMHDWWLYLTATCFGEVYYDNRAYIQYRQHGKNTSGVMLNKRNLLKYRLTQLQKPRGEIYRQIACFRESYKCLLTQEKYEKNVRLLEQLLFSEKSAIAKICVALNHKLFRQKLEDDLVFRLVVLIGKL